MRTYSILVLALVLAGCGGSGGSSTPSPFAGTWDGPFPPGGDQGTLSLTIGTDGTTNGTSVDQTYNLTGTIRGSISNTGVFSGTVQYPGYQAASLNGVLSITAGGQLTGNYTESLQGQQVNGTITLTKQ